MSHSSASSIPSPSSRRALRFGVLILLAALWAIALLDWSELAYRWVVQRRSPHPEIGLATLEPRLPFLGERQVLVARGEVIWERPEGLGDPVLFTARGPEGEAAVRLAITAPPPARGVRTVGFAVRRGSDWVFVAAAEAADWPADPPSDPPEVPALVDPGVAPGGD